MPERKEKPSPPDTQPEDQSGYPAINEMGLPVEDQPEPDRPAQVDEEAVNEPAPEGFGVAPEGGRYEVDGQLVNANGEPIKGGK